jgi:hypothetical protein
MRRVRFANHIAKMVLIGTSIYAATVSAQDLKASESTTAPTASQQEAKVLLMSMATELSDAQRFQVDVQVAYDAVQDDGQKIEFGETRQISVERPSLLLTETQDSDGTGEYLLFDGQWITVGDLGAKVYARAPQPGDIDASIKYFLNGLHMRLPLAAMLMRGFPQELEKRTLAINTVEETDILGEPAKHLAGRMKDVDFQVWIATKNRPLPLRIVLTYREAPGQPQFRANFSNWSFNPVFPKNMFAFSAQPGAVEVPLAASFVQHTATGTDANDAAPATTGETP